MVLRALVYLQQVIMYLQHDFCMVFIHSCMCRIQIWLIIRVIVKY